MARRALVSRAATAGERAVQGRFQFQGVGNRNLRLGGKVNLETEIAEQLQRLSDSPFAPDFGPAPVRPEFQTDREVPFLGDLERSIADIRGREVATTPGELAGLEGMFEAADPTLRLQKAQDFINQIVGPQQEAAAVKAGFGRGPAALEATTRAGAELALPIVTEAGRQQTLANQFKVALEHARLGRMESKDRAVFEAVLNKVQQGQTTAGLNAQERAALASFNLSSAGLRGEQEVARANISLGTQDRTLNLLNQLRTMRTSQAQINAGLAGRSLTGEGGRPASGASGGGDVSPDVAAQLAFEKTQLAATERQAGFDRASRETLAYNVEANKRLAANPLSSFGGLTSGSGAAPAKTSFITSIGPTGAQRKTLFGSSVFS